MPPVTMYPPSEVGKESKPKAASLFVDLESTRALMNVALDGEGGGGAGFAAAALSGVDVERARVVIWGVPAFLLVLGAISLERRGPIPAWPPLRALGDASYSLYLVHGLAISAAFRLLQKVGVGSPVVLLAASLTAGVAAGLIAYHLIEKPLMKLFKTGMAARRERGRDRGPEYLAVLGLEPGATAEQIKTRYRDLAREHHPDRGGDTARMAEINEAYETLVD